MTEHAQGPVQSAITDLMQHMEVAMWSRGVDPQIAMEVLNVMMFGDYRGNSRGGTVTGIPGWAADLGDKLLDFTDRSVAARRKEHGVTTPEGFADDVRLVILALVRKTLQDMPDTFEQVLAPRKS
jgi:hypothetical protein